MTQYAVIRTAKDQRKLVWKELQQGRLRQGWGWQPEQDLRLILAKKKDGQELNEDEKVAWRNKRMLSDTWNGLREGDVAICPNLPEQGRWVIARIEGPYRYEEHPEHDDFRHILPVKPLRSKDGTIAIVNPNDPVVDARLRGTMRTMSRMWGIDNLGDAVEEIIAAIASDSDLSEGQTKEQRREGFLTDIRKQVADMVWERVEKVYRGAEFEHLLIPLLESVYGDGAVEHRGGAGEKGADLIVTTQGPLGLTFQTAIQVKMYDGTHYDTHPLDQLRRARKEHGVQAGVVLTTANEVSQEFQDALVNLGEELKIDIQAWTREDFVRLLLAHLGRREDPMGERLG